MEDRTLLNFCELEKSDTSKIFNLILETINASYNNIRIFNDTITDKIPAIINSTSKTIKGKKISFSNTRIVKDGSQLPMDIRRKEKNYLLSIFTTLDIDGVKEEITLGNLPLMLGSKECPLSRMDEKELVEAGEDPFDKFGYFILSTEKFIVLQEKLRVSNPFVLLNKAGTVLYNTLPCVRGTQILSIGVSKNGTIVVYPHHFPDKVKANFPVFVLFKIFGVEAERALSLILQFIPEEERLLCQKELYHSLLEMKEILSHDSDGIKFIKEKIDAIQKQSTWSVERAKQILLDDIYPQIPESEDKFLHLAMMTAQFVRYTVGYRPLDNRDSWANKRIDTAGNQIEKLFMIVWANQLNEWELHLKEVTHSSLQAINLITKNFTKSFNPNKWGFSKSKRKENIVDILKRDTRLSILNQINRISTPRDKNERGSAVRMVQPSQLGYVCLFESPEGDTIGLVKYMASTSIISIGRSVQPFLDLLSSPEIEGVISKEWSDTFLHPILVNGIIRAYTSDQNLVKRFLLEKRRKCQIRDSKGEIISDCCIFWNPIDYQLQIYCDSGRMVRPLFVVNPETGKLFIEEAASLSGGSESGVWKMRIDDLLQNGFVELVDAREQEYTTVCESYEFLIRNRLLPHEGEEKVESEIFRKDFEYCEIDPNAMFGLMSLLAPKANHQQGPRIAYQAGMGKQSLTDYNVNHHSRFDTSYKVLRGGTRALFETEASEALNLNQAPNGQSLFVAIMAFPNNAEDAIVANYNTVGATPCGKMQYYKYFTVTEEVSLKKTENGEMLEIPKNIRPSEIHKFRSIGENKLPIIGSHIKKGDYILPKISCNNGERNRSTIAGVGEDGIVDRINVNIDGTNAKIKIKFRKRRYYTLGAKAEARYAQKGVIADIIPASDLPFIVTGKNRGITPDLFVNPHSLPKRMTMGLLYEYLSGKIAAMTGVRVNASSFRSLFFNSKEFEEASDFITVQEWLRLDVQRVKREMEEYSIPTDGKELMAYDRGNGKIEIIPQRIFCAPVYYQCLKHHAEDKEQARSSGVKDVKTQQPSQGRAIEGGLRFGEMERDALISHGASGMLLECLFEASDKYRIVLCRECGLVPTCDHSYEYVCNVCGKKNFCTVMMPYVMKCLVQSLGGCGIEVSFKLKEIVK